MASIPSISGYEAWGFKKHFWLHVEKDRVTGHPIRGTVGIDYNVHADLAALSAGPGLSQKSLQAFYEGDAHRGDGLATTSEVISVKQAKVVSDFYAFASGDQPYFFLRKGKTCLGLCRKKGGYLYWPREGAFKGHVYMHRVEFDFIRPPTPEEQIQTNALGQVPMSLCWVPTPAEARPVPEMDTVAERRRLTEDLKSITSLLSSIQSRMNALNA
jgi:hypothetical protein